MSACADGSGQGDCRGYIQVPSSKEGKTVRGRVDAGAVRYRCIQSEADRLGAQVIAIGGIEDHVHVLVKYAPSLALSELVKQMKGVSSRLVNDQIAPGGFFKWQGAYGAFSIAERDVPMVRRYIHRQVEHHRTGRLNATLERILLADPASSVDA